MSAGAQAVLCLMFLVTLPWTALGNDEINALYALRQSLTDPAGTLQSWDRSLATPCVWFHITCNPDNKVIRIDLANAGLSGSLVPELGILSELQYVMMYSNNISGVIPPSLGKLTNLVSLDLSENNLEGCIPASLGLLSDLQFLRLNNNHLTGEIPLELTRLYALRVLNLSYNDLVGVVPVTGVFAMFTPISFVGNPRLHYPYRGTLSPAPSFEDHHHLPKRLMLDVPGQSSSLGIPTFKALVALISYWALLLLLSSNR